MIAQSTVFCLTLNIRNEGAAHYGALIVHSREFVYCSSLRSAVWLVTLVASSRNGIVKHVADTLRINQLFSCTVVMYIVGKRDSQRK